MQGRSDRVAPSLWLRADTLSHPPPPRSSQVALVGPPDDDGNPTIVTATLTETCFVRATGDPAADYGCALSPGLVRPLSRVVALCVP